MPILEDTYAANGLFKLGQANTILTFLLRNPRKASYIRERITTPDKDFLDIDLLINDHRKAIFLFHGLEGSSNSQYMHGAASIFSDHGWDVIAMNYRGCSGSNNRHLHSYHSGQTRDVNFVINHYIKNYDEAVLLGFSLGGNKIMKYNGDHLYPLDTKIKASISVSAPIDLAGSAAEITKPKNYFYEKRFLKTLLTKARLKSKEYPHLLDPSVFKKINSLVDFDDHFTGPVHGFENAKDYYNQCNSLQFLKDLRIPALLLTAKDDPFLPDSCYPHEEAGKNPLLHLLVTKYGGHVGFYTKGKSYYWSEIAILKFAEKYTP